MNKVCSVLWQWPSPTLWSAGLLSGSSAGCHHRLFSQTSLLLVALLLPPFSSSCRRCCGFSSPPCPLFPQRGVTVFHQHDPSFTVSGTQYAAYMFCSILKWSALHAKTQCVYTATTKGSFRTNWKLEGGKMTMKASANWKREQKMFEWMFDGLL